MNMPGLYLEFSTNVARIMQDVAQIRGGIGNATREINSMIATTKSVMGALGAGLSVAGLLAFGKHTIDTIAKMKDLGQEAGVTAEAISKFEAPARAAGSSLDAVAGTMFKMSKAALEARDPSSKAAQAFAAIGISVKDIKDLKPDELFELVARQMAKYGDGLEKNAVSQELAGKSGREMNRVYAEIAERGKLVATVTNEEAEAADRFGDQLVELKMNSEKTWRSIASEGLPTLNAMLRAFIDGKKEAGLLQGAINALGAVFDKMGGIDTLEGQLKRVNEQIRIAREAKERIESRGTLTSWMTSKEEVALAASLNDHLKNRANIEKLIFAQEIEAQNKRATGGAKALPKPNFDPAAQKAAADAAKKYADELIALYNRLDNTTEGVNAKFWQELSMLHNEFERGNMTIEVYRTRVEELTRQTNYGKEVTKQQTEAAKFANEEAERAIKLDERLQQAKVDLIKDMRIEAERIELETKYMGLSNAERAKAIALHQMQSAKVELTAEQMEVLANRIRDAAAAQEAMRNTLSVWDEIANRGSKFFSDLFTGGKKAFDSLKDMVKDFARELIALFAKKWILNMAAAAAGGSTGTALAGQAASAGSGSLAGAALQWGGNAAASYFGYSGLGTMADLAAGWSSGAAFGVQAGTTGVLAEGATSLAGTAGEWMATLGATGWGLIIVAAVAVLAAFFSKNGGGPKAEGSFSGTIGANGTFTNNPGANPFNYATHNADEAMGKVGAQLAMGFTQTLAAFGVSSRGFGLSGGIVKDPAGDSQTFLDLLLTSPTGKELLRQHNDQVGRSDEDIQKEMGLQWQRAALAALQDADIPGVLGPALKDIFNSVAADTASPEELQRVFTEAQNFQALWGQFQDMFSTDTQKLAAAQANLAKAFESLGLSVPKDSAEFKKLVEGLDLSTEEGRNLFKALMQLAPAFKAIEEASDAAKQAIEDDWKQVSRLLGRTTEGGDLLAQFQANNPWAAGKTLEQLIADLRTITEADFKGYSEENRKLIIAILGLQDSVDGAADSITTAVQAIYFPEVGANTLQGDFESRYGGLIGSVPGLMGQMSLRSQLMTGQVQQWQQQQSGLSPYSAEWQTLQKAIDDFKEKIRLTGVDIARLTVLTAQYGESKAEELFNLEKWYEAQKALVDGNAEAMDALKKIFGDKWKAIIDGIASDDAKARLADWWKGLFLDEKLSPLTLRQKFDLSKKDYEAALAGGDLGKIQSTATAFLQFARQLFGSSSDYTSIFAQVVSQTGGLAGMTQADINARLYGALPTASTIASATDINMLARTFVSEIRDLVTATMRSDAETRAAIQESGDRIAGVATQPRQGALA